MKNVYSNKQRRGWNHRLYFGPFTPWLHQGWVRLLPGNKKHATVKKWLCGTDNKIVWVKLSSYSTFCFKIIQVNVTQFQNDDSGYRQWITPPFDAALLFPCIRKFRSQTVPFLSYSDYIKRWEGLAPRPWCISFQLKYNSTWHLPDFKANIS